MKLPKSLKVGGQTYKVVEVSGLGDSGSTQFETQTILINKEQTDQRKQTALLHEGIECINELYDLNLPHTTIQTLEAALFQMAVDNNLL